MIGMEKGNCIRAKIWVVILEKTKKARQTT